MKKMYTHFVIVMALLSLSSCESEYDRQMQLAEDVIKQSVETEMLHSDRLEFSIHPIQNNDSIEDQIDYHAHMSGNSEMFHKELAEFKKKIESDARQLALNQKN